MKTSLISTACACGQTCGSGFVKSYPTVYGGVTVSTPVSPIHRSRCASNPSFTGVWTTATALTCDIGGYPHIHRGYECDGRAIQMTLPQTSRQVRVVENHRVVRHLDCRALVLHGRILRKPEPWAGDTPS